MWRILIGCPKFYNQSEASNQLGIRSCKKSCRIVPRTYQHANAPVCRLLLVNCYNISCYLQKANYSEQTGCWLSQMKASQPKFRPKVIPLKEIFYFYKEYRLPTPPSHSRGQYCSFFSEKSRLRYFVRSFHCLKPRLSHVACLNL